MTHAPDEIAAMIEKLKRWFHGGQSLRDIHSERLEAAAMLRDVAAERDALAVAEQNAFNQRNMALDELKLAEAERDRLAAMVEKLIDYAEHGKRCPQYSVWDGTCTCGLSDVLEESENGQ